MTASQRRVIRRSRTRSLAQTLSVACCAILVTPSVSLAAPFKPRPVQVDNGEAASPWSEPSPATRAPNRTASTPTSPSLSSSRNAATQIAPAGTGTGSASRPATARRADTVQMASLSPVATRALPGLASAQAHGSQIRASQTQPPQATVPQQRSSDRAAGLSAAADASQAVAILIAGSTPVSAPAVRPPDVAAFQKIGAPYQANGIWYIPAHEPDYDETGTASWYGRDFHGRPTANGEIFDMNMVTAAHPTLPIPSLVEVTNLENGRSMIVRVNDRGPFVANRLIDVSARGAEVLGFKERGSTQVRVRYVGPATPEPLVTEANLSAARDDGISRVGQSAATSARAPARHLAGTPYLAPAVTHQPASRKSAAAQPNDAGFVQAGVFARRNNAMRLAQQVGGLGQVQLVETTNAIGAPIFKVLVGPVSDAEAAQQTIDELNDLGVSGAKRVREAQ